MLCPALETCPLGDLNGIFASVLSSASRPETHRPTPLALAPPNQCQPKKPRTHYRRGRMIDEFHRQGQASSYTECIFERRPTPLSLLPPAKHIILHPRSNSKTRLTPPHRTAPHACTLKTGSPKTAPIQPCRLIICPHPNSVRLLRVCGVGVRASGRVQLAGLVRFRTPLTLPCEDDHTASSQVSKSKVRGVYIVMIIMERSSGGIAERH